MPLLDRSLLRYGLVLLAAGIAYVAATAVLRLGRLLWRKEWLSPRKPVASGEVNPLASVVEPGSADGGESQRARFVGRKVVVSSRQRSLIKASCLLAMAPLSPRLLEAGLLSAGWMVLGLIFAVVNEWGSRQRPITVLEIADSGLVIAIARAHLGISISGARTVNWSELRSWYLEDELQDEEPCLVIELKGPKTNMPADPPGESIRIPRACFDAREEEAFETIATFAVRHHRLTGDRLAGYRVLDGQAGQDSSPDVRGPRREREWLPTGAMRVQRLP